MTASKAESGSAYFLTGQQQSAESAGAEVIVREFSPSRPMPLKDTHTLSDVVARLSKRGEVASRLPDARRRIGASLYGGEPATLASLRLHAGMSQASLAQKAGTSQPHIARVERGQSDPGTDLIVRIAQALSVESSRVFESVLAHRDAVSGQK